MEINHDAEILSLLVNFLDSARRAPSQHNSTISFFPFASSLHDAPRRDTTLHRAPQRNDFICRFISTQRASSRRSSGRRNTAPRDSAQRLIQGDNHMRTAAVTIKSAAPYSQSRAHETPKNERETADAHEQRTWREKCHYTAPDNRIFIPPMSFKMGLDKAAQMLGTQVPGKGKATYTKFFLSGVLVMEPLVLPLTRDDADCDRIYANADGKRGSGKRVWRLFPRINAWEGEVIFNVLSDEITPKVFEDTLRQAGAFVGIGRFRPENGGYYGRYAIERIRFS